MNRKFQHRELLPLWLLILILFHIYLSKISFFLNQPNKCETIQSTDRKKYNLHVSHQSLSRSFCFYFSIKHFYGVIHVLIYIFNSMNIIPICTMYGVGIVEWLNQTRCVQRTRKFLILSKESNEWHKEEKLQKIYNLQINIKTNSSLVIFILLFSSFLIKQDKLYTNKKNAHLIKNTCLTKKWKLFKEKKNEESKKKTKNKKILKKKKTVAQ